MNDKYFKVGEGFIARYNQRNELRCLDIATCEAHLLKLVDIALNEGLEFVE
jgi:hypothetical protein